jgi:hypothetical protein
MNDKLFEYRRGFVHGLNAALDFASQDETLEAARRRISAASAIASKIWPDPNFDGSILHETRKQVRKQFRQLEAAPPDAKKR